MLEEPKTGDEAVGAECQEKAKEIEAQRWQHWEDRVGSIADLKKRGLFRGILDDPKPIKALLFDGLTSNVFLPRKTVGIFAGAGNVGKTFAEIQLALSVSTGKPWLGEQGFHVAPDAIGAVFLMIAEEDDDTIQERLHAAAQDMGLTKEEVEQADRNIYPLSLVGVSGIAMVDREGNPSKEFHEKMLKTLAAIAPDGGWRLIIVDPASRFMGQDCEVDSHKATNFICALEQFLKLPGEPSVLAAFHTTKGARKQGEQVSAADVRGSSGLIDAARWIAQLKEEEENRISLTHTKASRRGKARPRDIVREAGGVLKACGVPNKETNPAKTGKRKLQQVQETRPGIPGVDQGSDDDDFRELV